MKSITTGLFLVALVLALVTGPEVSACTSFMLKADHGLYFVHSLNHWESVPGDVFINQRHAWKKGYSWEALIKIDSNTAPGMVWQSQYGSVTFNPLGKDLPDGGLNEAGLYIWEMGFDTKYPSEDYKPKLFQAQWMQYVLDNLSTVDEAIENAYQMAIDGWGWHYFVADKSGRTAIIDFVDGRPIVYTGETMPVPLCCNSIYPDAIKWLKQHKGFGGELDIEQIHEEIPRFIYGAKLLQEYRSQDPVDYSFYVLDEMSKNVRWSIVFHVNNGKAYFKTNTNQNIRYFAFTPDDFGRSDGPLRLDIECPGPTDIRGQFALYSPENDKRLMKGLFEALCEIPDFKKMLLDDQGADVDLLVQSFIGKMLSSDSDAYYGIDGNWEGTAVYPAGEETQEFPMTLSLSSVNANLTGTINDGEAIINLPMTNIVHKGGLLCFTVKIPDTEKTLYYQLYASVNEMKGFIEFNGDKRKGTVSLHR